MLMFLTHFLAGEWVIRYNESAEALCISMLNPCKFKSLAYISIHAYFSYSLNTIYFAASAKQHLMNEVTHNKIVSFIWGIADDVLRDLFKRGKCPDVMCAQHGQDLGGESPPVS